MNIVPRYAYALALCVLGCAACGPRERASNQPGAPAGPAKELTFTVVPYEAAEKLSEDYTPMAEYLGRRLGRRGRFLPVVDYAGVVAALQTGQVDVAYLSSFPYALATSRMKLHALAMPYVKGSLTYRGMIFVRADSPIRTLQDLAGKTMAFGDAASTSGYLLPRALLERAGVFGKLKSWRNAGSAPVVLKAVESRTDDAGAAFDNLIEMVYKDRPREAVPVRVLAYTEAIPNGIYVARGDMSSEEVEALRKAFLDMNTDPVGKAAMRRAPNDRIVPADDRMFDGVRKAASILGLDLTSLDRK